MQTSKHSKTLRKRYLILSSILLLGTILQAQPGHLGSSCQNEAFEKKINRMLDFDVPTMGVTRLKKLMEEGKDIQIIDSRTAEEYQVSSIPGASLLTYKDYTEDDLEAYDKSKPVIVYCSIGYRSEQVAKELKEAGFEEVYNLYGSIFEWANRHYPLTDIRGDTTRLIHGYNRNWAQWIDDREDLKKVW